MHEYALVEWYVDTLQQRLWEEGRPRVKRVRFRRGSTITEGAVRQAWVMATRGTELESAALEIEADVKPFVCSCGDERVLHADDLVAHLWVCPVCAAIHEVDEAHDLALVEAIVE